MGAPVSYETVEGAGGVKSRAKGTTTNRDVLGEPRLGWLQRRAWDFWFAPKRFESLELYEQLGVLWLKRYVPTGGDYFRKKYGVRVIAITNTIESLLKFEHRTRLYEAIHLGAFLAFLLFSIWQLVSGRTNGSGFVMACVVYVLLILSPVLLQRYNRICVYEAIRRMRNKQVSL
jgi:Glycosyl-4,4'-diaponeurosporenoate acyltransferase